MHISSYFLLFEKMPDAVTCLLCCIFRCRTLRFKIVIAADTVLAQLPRRHKIGDNETLFHTPKSTVQSRRVEGYFFDSSSVAAVPGGVYALRNRISVFGREAFVNCPTSLRSRMVVS